AVLAWRPTLKSAYHIATLVNFLSSTFKIVKTMSDLRQSVRQGIVKHLYKSEFQHVRDSATAGFGRAGSIKSDTTSQESFITRHSTQQRQPSVSGRASAATTTVNDSRPRPDASVPNLTVTHCSICDGLSISLTFVTCLLYATGFYLWLFHGLFPAENAGLQSAADIGIYSLCSASGLLLVHILLCFGRVALNSSPSQRELELFTAFSRQCKMLTAEVHEVESAATAAASATTDFNDDSDQLEPSALLMSRR
ncbi:hypothetical protein BOX15_Mlig009162g3, partial [Macrostomum lignano]